MINDSDKCDNYDSVLNSLLSFIVDKAPVGAEKDVKDLKKILSDKEQTSWIHLEYRPHDDGVVNLYVRIQSPKGKFGRMCVTTSDGFEFSVWRVQCEVSWSSYSPDDLNSCQRRLDVINTVMAFARQIEANFKGEFYKLESTPSERKEREAAKLHKTLAEKMQEIAVPYLKGMRVGQEKVVPSPGWNFQPLGEVDFNYSFNKGKFKGEATGPDSFYLERVA